MLKPFNNKILLFSIGISLVFHLAGFVLFRIKNLEAQPLDSYVEVGLVESHWQERWVELPGEEQEDIEFLEPTEHLKTGWGRTPNMDKIDTPGVELPMTGIIENQKIDIENVNGAQTDKPSLVFYGHQKNKIRPIDISGPVAKRKVLFQRFPKYPIWAQSYGLEFEVKLKFWVATTGEVNRVVIENSCGYPEVDAQVVRAMKLWRFESADVQNEPQWGTILFKFRLKP